MNIRKLLNELEVLDRPPSLDKQKQKQSIPEPGGWVVIIRTKWPALMQLIIDALTTVVPMDKNKAEIICKKLHVGTKDTITSAYIATYKSKEIAEMKVNKLNAYIKNDTKYEDIKNIYIPSGADWPIEFYYEKQ
jgi:ATP-dependent Clp protease adapter protein ClpS